MRWTNPFFIGFLWFTWLIDWSMTRAKDPMQFQLKVFRRRNFQTKSNKFQRKCFKNPLSMVLLLLMLWKYRLRTKRSIEWVNVSEASHSSLLVVSFAICTCFFALVMAIDKAQNPSMAACHNDVARQMIMNCNCCIISSYEERILIFIKNEFYVLQWIKCVITWWVIGCVHAAAFMRIYGKCLKPGSKCTHFLRLQTSERDSLG